MRTYKCSPIGIICSIFLIYHENRKFQLFLLSIPSPWLVVLLPLSRHHEVALAKLTANYLNTVLMKKKTILDKICPVDEGSIFLKISRILHALNCLYGTWAHRVALAVTVPIGASRRFGWNLHSSSEAWPLISPPSDVGQRIPSVPIASDTKPWL